MTAAEWSRGPILGGGSTATVFLASSPSSAVEPFAVKSSDIARSGFLQREQRVHSSIPHSHHIISYLGSDMSADPSGTYYNLFLEYAPGGSLIDEIKKNGGSLDEAGIRARTKDIMLGLAHLHSMKIAHCDVKGQNVLIGCDGRAKIADFGCARFVDGDCDGGEGHFSGTPMFMAPEVARGEAQGTPADVWAVGCTVIQMATGRPPWPDATDAVSLIHRIAFSGDAPEVPTWLSGEGKDFLGKCLCRESEERWTAAELLRHPFLSDSGSGCEWTSPKSTLDRSCWDSLMMSESDNEGRNDFDSTSDKPNAINELFRHGSEDPEWTWDGDWMTVRTDEDQSAADEALVGDVSPSTPSSSTISTIISISESNGFLFSTNYYAVKGNFSDVTSDDCDCKGAVDCESEKQCVGFLVGSFPSVSSCHFGLCCVVFSPLVVGLIRPNEFFLKEEDLLMHFSLGLMGGGPKI